jgi:hypothetical protein
MQFVRNDDTFDLLILEKEVLLIELDRELRSKMNGARSISGRGTTGEGWRRCERHGNEVARTNRGRRSGAEDEAKMDLDCE